jgi:putative endonuclease
MAKPDSPSTPERVKAFRTGLSAESRAAALLIAKGYRILARRFRTARSTSWRGTAAPSPLSRSWRATASMTRLTRVTPRQQARIIAAAQGWLMAHGEHEGYDLRFDAILIAPRSLPRHAMAAFDASP